MDGVSFTVGEAEVLGIVGESGCGKTVTCRTIMGLMPARTAYSAGEVIYHPRGPGNLLDLAPRDLQRLRGTQLAMIFQDPMTALNPVRTVGDQVTEAVTAHATLSRPQARDRTVELLTRVGIPAPASRMRDYPFQFSGGMLQRALIAIALASSPRLLLADEPTTSLDVIIQDQILSLLLELQRDTGMSVIPVSHDLAVITEVCGRVIVMYGGQVEQRGPLHSLPGSLPSLIDVPAGCRSVPRCPLAMHECTGWITELVETGGPGHRVRCWRHHEVERARTWQATDSA